mmetsp:Transcript_41507/g.88435  ORF Transcript_41507/g.88435 Transcript_41507/m.88435 type:complete len:640 (+) Transcript_41507:108-2027(+)
MMTRCRPCTLPIIITALSHGTNSFIHPKLVRNTICLGEHHVSFPNGIGINENNFATILVHSESEGRQKDRYQHTCCPSLLTGCQFEKWHELCEDVDKILEGLVSPAPESFHVLHSALSKINCERGRFDECVPEVGIVSALNDLRALSSFLVKPNYAIELYLDTEGLKWRLIPRENHNENVILLYECNCIEEGEPELYHLFNTLQLSRLALDLATKTPNDPQLLCKINDIAQQAQKRLALTMGSDLRGPTSSDTSFNFVLAGAQRSSTLFQTLCCIGMHELERSGPRASFQPKNILHMVEKFAACDIRGQPALDLYHTAGVCLEKKGYRDARLIQSLKGGSFGFHSDRPLIWLWRFSSKQKKVSLSAILSKAKDRRTVEWDQIFYDASKPLVCDIGSGMGTSLLNLSVLTSIGRAKDNSNPSDELQMTWSRCNYVGADLNRAMVNFGNGIISRDKARRVGRVHFLCLSAEDFLTELCSYPGEISLAMINFPSPYRLCGEGNLQLPSKDSDKFMVTKNVLLSIAELIGREGLFLFQTKCEDLAVHVKNECLSLGAMEFLPIQNSMKNVDIQYEKNGKRPKRVDEWLKVVPFVERAEGFMYSSASLLPKGGRPETEVQCSHDGSVVHRFILKSKVRQGETIE